MKKINKDTYLFIIIYIYNKMEIDLARSIIKLSDIFRQYDLELENFKIDKNESSYSYNVYIDNINEGFLKINFRSSKNDFDNKLKINYTNKNNVAILFFSNEIEYISSLNTISQIIIIFKQRNKDHIDEKSNQMIKIDNENNHMLKIENNKNINCSSESSLEEFMSHKESNYASTSTLTEICNYSKLTFKEIISKKEISNNENKLKFKEFIPSEKKMIELSKNIFNKDSQETLQDNINFNYNKDIVEKKINENKIKEINDNTINKNEDDKDINNLQYWIDNFKNKSPEEILTTNYPTNIFIQILKNCSIVALKKLKIIIDDKIDLIHKGVGFNIYKDITSMDDNEEDNMFILFFNKLLKGNKFIPEIKKILKEKNIELVTDTLPQKLIIYSSNFNKCSEIIFELSKDIIQKIKPDIINNKIVNIYWNFKEEYTNDNDEISLVNLLRIPVFVTKLKNIFKENNMILTIQTPYKLLVHPPNLLLT